MDTATHVRKCADKTKGLWRTACGLDIGLIADTDTEIPGVGFGTDLIVTEADKPEMIYQAQIHAHYNPDGTLRFNPHVHPWPYSPPRPQHEADKQFTIALRLDRRRISYALAPLLDGQILQLALFLHGLWDLACGIDSAALQLVGRDLSAYYDSEVASGRVRGFPKTPPFPAF